MNIKTVIMGAVSAFALVSCSAKIPVQIAMPAQLNLGRGAKLSISYTGERFAENAASKFAELVKKEGYYAIAPQGYSNYSLELKGMYKDGNPINCARFYISSATNLLLKKEVCVGIFHWDPAEVAAKESYHIIAPHEETLEFAVKPNTPELKEVVELCKSGQWDKAREHMKQVMIQYPNDPENYYMMSVVEVKDMNYDASDVWLHKALSIKNDKRYIQALKNNSAMRVNDAAVVRQLSSQN